MHLKLINSTIGCDFFKVVNQAKSILVYDMDSCVFDFNGKIIRVTKETDVDWLWSQYLLCSYLDEIKSVGFFDIEKEIKDVHERVEKKKKEYEKLEEKWKQKHIQKVEAATKVADVAKESHPFIYQIYGSLREDYLKLKEAHKGYPYDEAVFSIAETIMSVSSYLNKPIKFVIEEAENVADFYVGGCSGYQMSVAKGILRKFWIYRELV